MASAASGATEPKRPVVLCILDGWGHREERAHNAVALADTPVVDRLARTCPSSLLRTDGPFVGLPEGQFGNSEVGHMTLGAGRVVMQELPRIDAALADGTLAASTPFRRFVDGAGEGRGRVHVLGLLSPGGVHAHQRHLAAIVARLAEAGLESVLHLFFDGRDTAPSIADDCLERLRADLAGVGAWSIGSGAGRYYAMDRDRRWERVSPVYDAIVAGEGPRVADAEAGIARARAAGRTDEFVEPFVVEGYEGVAEGDALICVNFRADRVRQLMRALTMPDFDGFTRERVPRWSAAAGMTRYADDLDEVLITLFPPASLDAMLGEVIAACGGRQLRAAETEKYPHVTFFFNGGREEPFEGEERILVPSPKVATYDLQPEMSADALTDRVTEAIEGGDFTFVLVNYANPDMVGHTGDEDAARRAVETVDRCLGRLMEAVGRKGGRMLVTADHGNCEMMVDPKTGAPHTAHTLQPVDCRLVFADPALSLRDGGLADVAPTLLELLALDQPASMTGRSLLRRGDG